MSLGWFDRDHLRITSEHCLQRARGVQLVPQPQRNSDAGDQRQGEGNFRLVHRGLTLASESARCGLYAAA